MKLSIITPVFNEEENLEGVIQGVMAVRFPCELEIVLVDDCSTDDSWKVIEKLAENSKIKAHRQEVNGGKGAALHKGIELVTGDIITIHDADYEYDPKDLINLVQPIIDNKADVVYGSRFKKTSPQVHRTMHYLGNRVLTLLSNLFSGLYLSDMETCYKVFRADILKALNLESKRFGFEPEVTAKVSRLHVRVHEYPISYFPRTYLEGKKISWKDGLAAIWHIVKFNFQKLPPQTWEKLPKKYHPKGYQWL